MSEIYSHTDSTGDWTQDDILWSVQLYQVRHLDIQYMTESCLFYLNIQTKQLHISIRLINLQLLKKLMKYSRHISSTRRVSLVGQWMEVRKCLKPITEEMLWSKEDQLSCSHVLNALSCLLQSLQQFITWFIWRDIDLLCRQVRSDICHCTDNVDKL